MSDQVRDSPWPSTEPVAFLCDASTDQERSLLREWVRSTDPRADGSTPVELTQVELEDDRTGKPLQRVLEQPEECTLVPLRVVWLPDQEDKLRTGPRVRDLLLGDPRNPRPLIGKFLRQQHPDRARCIAGAPATLEQLRASHTELVGDGDSSEDFPAFVLRQAGIALDVEERKLRGRRYKVPRLVIQGIEASKRYQVATARAARDLDQTPQQVREKTRKYLEEMVATPSAFFIDWMGMLTRRITSLGYKGIVTEPKNIEQARQLLRDHPTALLWTHKSHVDAIALMSVMYDNDFPTPHSMGGINMAFAGVGYAGRRAGTVYIRRSFSDNPLYKLALQQYLGYLMEKRFPLSWAFEGTRSRTGKLGRPRYGLLKYAVDAAHVTGTEDLHIVPVAINYDLIGETADYARQESGAPKEAENLGWFVEYLRKLRSPMGNIYLDFAEPVVLEGRCPEASPELLARIAFETARRVNDRVPVTLTALMCIVALGAAPRALTYAELDRSLRQLMRWLRARGIRMARDLDREDLPELESLAENIFRGGVITRVTEGSETLFEIGEGQYPVASYYRNTIVHYFVDKAIGEVSLALVVDLDPALRLDTFWENARWLRDLTKFELYHTPSDRFAESVGHELERCDENWQQLLTGSSADVRGLLARFTPLVCHATLLPYLEAYWVVVKAVSELAVSDEPPSESAVVNRALELGRSSLRRRRVSSDASIGKAMFKNAYEFLGEKELLSADATQAREELGARLDRAIARVRQVAALAQPYQV